jgi:hypothetical protein
MTEDSDGNTEREEEFQAVLNELLLDATEDGVSVEGAWRCERDGDSGWEVLISRVVESAEMSRDWRTRGINGRGTSTDIPGEAVQGPERRFLERRLAGPDACP